MNKARKTLFQSLRLVISLFLILSLTSCAININSNISKELQPSTLSAAFNSKPANLRYYSKCTNSDIRVRIVNAEKRNEDVDITTSGLIGGVVFNPQELTNQIITYMQDALNKSGVIINHESDKVIEVSIKKAEILTGFFNRGAYIELAISIPEKKYIESFSATSWTGGMNMYRAMAYAIHETTWKVITDPVVKDYLLCTKMSTKEELPTGETALDILKKRYASGEITKDQFDRMKKNIQ